MKNIIKGEGMFDHANPSVIICSPELERALNMKALHVTEIRDLVLSQITKVPDQSLRKINMPRICVTIFTPKVTESLK